MTSKGKKILQLYYNPWFGNSMAKSAGLTDDQIYKAGPYFFYVFPDSKKRVNYPVALRYDRISDDESLLVNISSTGKDHLKRRNTFVHSLILSPNFFDEYPPIFYWMSPFWQYQESYSGPSELDSLSSLENIEMGLHKRDIWAFLDEVDNSRTLLYQLLCAVVHSKLKSRPIVIVDEPDQVAMWVAAVSLLLPPEHYKLLSFSTYTNIDVVQGVKFLINGLLPETKNIDSDYQSCVVFYPKSRSISQVEDSRYAKRVIETAYNENYNELQKLFNQLPNHFRHPRYFGQSIDEAIRYSAAIATPREQPQTSDNFKIMRSGLSIFKEGRVLDRSEKAPEELYQLCFAYELIRQKGELAEGYQTDYFSALSLLRDCHPSRARSILQSILGSEIKSGRLINSQLMENIHGIFDSNEIKEVANDAQLFTDLPQIIKQAPAQVLTSIWREVGPFFAAKGGAHVLSLLETSLSTAYSTRQDHRTNDEQYLLEKEIKNAIKGREQQWFQLAVEDSELSYDVLRRFYFDLIRLRSSESFSVRDRIPYRSIMVHKYPKIIIDEFKGEIWYHDNFFSKPEDFFKYLAEMISSIKEQEPLFENNQRSQLLADLIEEGLMTVEQRALWSEHDWHEFAKRAINDSLLTNYLSEERRTKLKQLTISGEEQRQITALTSAKEEENVKDVIVLEQEVVVSTGFPHRLQAFLCHSSGDKHIVRDLYQRLKTCNVDPWLDEENLLPGQNWEQEIRKAVRSSDVVIVCLSPGSISKTGFVQKEIKFALDIADKQPEGSIYLIPVKLEDCEPPERLNHLHWVNYKQQDGFYKLIKALQRRCNLSNGKLEPVIIPDIS